MMLPGLHLNENHILKLEGDNNEKRKEDIRHE